MTKQLLTLLINKTTIKISNPISYHNTTNNKELAEAKTTQNQKGRNFSFVQCRYHSNHTLQTKRRQWVVTSGAKCLLPRLLIMGFQYPTPPNRETASLTDSNGADVSISALKPESGRFAAVSETSM